MDTDVDAIDKFINFVNKCEGSEKKEGQIFFERLLQAFGNEGIPEADACLEKSIVKKGKKTTFADFVWKPRVIIELKTRGTPLQKHYDQALNYWIGLVPNRPKYMVLCNFDEFWIYDLNFQLDDPVHKLRTENLKEGWGALKFLLPQEEEPLFGDHHVAITEEVARTMGKIYQSLIQDHVQEGKAQRFILQLVIALFSQNVGLISQYTVEKILKKSHKYSRDLKDLFYLFKAMGTKNKSDKPGSYKDIPYFNGGIFKKTSPNLFDNDFEGIEQLYNASQLNWKKIKPSIFGNLFEASTHSEIRHQRGIHYTKELDIHKIISPCIIKPFKKKIEEAKTKIDKQRVLREIREFKILDPACGSGNFLYFAFRELSKLEIEVLEKINENKKPLDLHVSPRNFYGIDTNKFGLEIAKVSLSIGHKLIADEFDIKDNSLPFVDLDNNFLNQDALFIDWPKCDVIIGNPPFQPKNKIKNEMGLNYVNRLRKEYPGIPGRSDYCVYWFRKAHDCLSEKGMAGLIGTNTIGQNYSREGGLDYIIRNRGIIVEAVSSQKWPGEAIVYVSIVNWTKDSVYQDQSKKLFVEKENVKKEKELVPHEVRHIHSSLSLDTDISSAKILKANQKPKTAYQGQTHGNRNFLINRNQAEKIISKTPKTAEVLKPFLTAKDLIGSKRHLPERYVIDFSDRDILQAGRYNSLYKIIETKILPKRKEKAEEEKTKNERSLNRQTNKHHQNFLKTWWKLSYPRTDLMKKIRKIKRYCVCGQVTKRNIFEFIHSEINPNASLVVFTFDDDYSFGILQSDLHWLWFTNRCSTLKQDYRYTTDTVYDTFPWPQKLTLTQIEKVAEASKNLRQTRREIIDQNQLSYRKLYRSLELPGYHKLQKSHDLLNKTVRQAYGMINNQDPLEFLLNLNKNLYEKENRGEQIVGPGLTHLVNDMDIHKFVTRDCISL